MLICHCHAVNDKVLGELARGGASVEDMATLCGAGSDCGGCLESIAWIVSNARIEAAADMQLVSGS